MKVLKGTLRQRVVTMLDAPNYAFYLCQDKLKKSMEDLSEDLNRHDLIIISVSYFSSGNMDNFRGKTIILDPEVVIPYDFIRLLREKYNITIHTDTKSD